MATNEPSLTSSENSSETPWHMTILRRRNRYSNVPPNAKTIIYWLKKFCVDYLRFSCSHQITFGYEHASTAEGDVIIHFCFKSKRPLKTLRAAIYRHFKNRGRSVDRYEMTCTSHATACEEFFRLALAFEPVYKMCVGFDEETLKKMHAEAEREAAAALPQNPEPYKPRSKKAQAAFVQMAERMSDIEKMVIALTERMNAVVQKGNRMEQKVIRMEQKLDRVLELLTKAPPLPPHNKK